jgi:hypothetical protein
MSPGRAFIAAALVALVATSSATLTFEEKRGSAAKATSLLRSSKGTVSVRKHLPHAPSRLIVDSGSGSVPSALTFDAYSDARGEEASIYAFEATATGMAMTHFKEEVLSIVLKDPKEHQKEQAARAVARAEGYGLPDHLDVTSANHSTNEGAIGKQFADREYSHHMAAKTGSAPYVSEDTLGNPVLADRIHVKGTLNIPHGIAQIVTSGDLQVAGERQWKLAVTENFERVVDGWHSSSGSPSNKRNSCAKGLMERIDGDYFLGFYKDGYTTKTFQIPADHTKLRIRANFHFFDMWESQVAEMKVNGAVVWQKAHRTCDSFSLIPEVGGVCVGKGVNACGGDDPDTVGYVIEHTMSYFSDKVEISFGTTLPSSGITGSWGVDDIELYVA